VSLSIGENTGAERTGSLTIAGQTFTVTQSAPDCAFTVSPAAQAFAAAGGTGSVRVDASQGTCPWTTSSAAPWITVAVAGGTGSGTVAFTVAANTGGDRTGALTVAGRTVTITQPAPPPAACTFAINPGSASLAAEGGSAAVAVSTTASCAWTAASNAAWLTISGGGSGTGAGVATVTAAANTGAARSGTATIAGQTFTVNQAAVAPAPCTFSISPASQNVVASGGSGSVAVTASAPTCSWTAASNAGWVTIASGASGTGSGTVVLSYAANAGDVRSGTVTIAGQTFSATQAAAVACTFSISPENHFFDDKDGRVDVKVTASQPTCAWTATSNAPWISITRGDSGTGNGTVQVSVDRNSGDARGGTATIAGRTFGVLQRGKND